MTSEGIRDRVAPSGLRVVTERIPGFKSVALGFFFRQGSRDEEEAFNGSSHLVEHMLFKGTRRRSSKDILVEIERLGGISDGFTSKEISGITIRTLKSSLKPLLSLLLEMLEESKFAEEELKKEKEVVYEEMRSAEEDPQDIVFDSFYEACFKPHPLGYTVLGKKKNLETLSGKELAAFYRKSYTLSDAVFVATGDINQDELFELLPAKAKLLRGERKNRTRPLDRTTPIHAVTTRKDITQVHAALGTLTEGLNAKERFANALLSSLLGGGMSSRLFLSLREEDGLVYTISSFLDLFEDSGVSGFYFVTEKSKLERVVNKIESELARLLKSGLHKDELDTAKTLTKSSLILNMESLTHRMMRLGHWKLLAETFRTLEETIKEFEKVSEADVLELASRLFVKKPLHMSFVGPVTERDTNHLIRR